MQFRAPSCSVSGRDLNHSRKSMHLEGGIWREKGGNALCEVTCAASLCQQGAMPYEEDGIYVALMRCRLRIKITQSYTICSLIVPRA